MTLGLTHDALRVAYLAGQVEWPEIDGLSLEDFCQHLQRLGTCSNDLERHGSDIFLALACGRGDPEAIRALSSRHLQTLDDYLARSGFDGDTRQDILQQALMHLCTGESPRILTYAGRAALASWLRVAVHRFALQMVRQNGNVAARELSLDALVGPDVDVETRVTIEEARPRFQLAMQQALTDLDDRERTLLRLCFLDGLSIDAIGAMYGVHRATAARWLQNIRRQLFVRVQSTLQSELGLRDSEFESLAFLIQTGIHLSLRRVLGAA
jgi:RNA polymerase sigma-70 factor, ECF subfamily